MKLDARRSHRIISKGSVMNILKLNWCTKYVHEVLVNRLGGLSLPRKSVVRLTDRPDMTLDVYRGRKTTMQQQQQQHYLRIDIIFPLYEFQVDSHL